MSKEFYFASALALATIAMVVLQMMFPQIPLCVGLPIVALLGVLTIILIVQGIRKSNKTLIKQALKDQNGTRDLIIWIDSYRFGYNPNNYTPKDSKAVVLGMHVTLNAIAPARIEGIGLELLGERYQSDFEPMERAENGRLGAYIYFELSSNLKAGQYIIYIVVCADGYPVRSKDYPINYQPKK